MWIKQLSTSIKNLDNNSVSDISYTYDKNGNRLTQNKDGEITTYTYNGLDQLVSYTSTKDGQLQVSQTNEYNGDGKRISKNDNGVTTKYYYQDDEVLYTTDGDGNINCFNIVGDSDNYTGTIRYNTGKPVYYSYNKDIKGSVSNVITGVYGADGNTSSGNADNTITALTSVVSYDYDDFGNTTIKGNTEFYNEICFADAIYDVSTGLYYMNARYIRLVLRDV